jgi:Calcineurin-like phosphoesterase
MTSIQGGGFWRFGVSLVLGTACASGVPVEPGQSSGTAPGPLQDSTATEDLTKAGACKACVSDTECAGHECAQFAGDSFCAPLCTTQGKCSTGRVCTDVSTAHGVSEKVCIPAGDLCGTAVTSPVPSLGMPPTPGPVTGTIGVDGGSLSKLFFAVVGDTRPPIINDTRAYPTAVIGKIYADIEALSPRPHFAVSSGDYIFSTGNGTQAAPQFDLYQAARTKFSGTLFPAMGNHECTGAVTSNCGTVKDGTPANYTAFLSKMLSPIGKTKPYYDIRVDALDHKWTSKFLFVAANAWDAAQGAWMKQAMAKPTTYTFVVRHEPVAASNAPGVKPSEAIMAQFPYTLAIVGHTHTYAKTGPRQVTMGNGGAPLTGGSTYGFGLISQRADDAIQVDMIDYQTGKADLGFRFALKADGSPAP